MNEGVQQRHRERLWPAPWVFLATALVMPASLLVFTPIDLVVGGIVAVVLYAAIVALLLSGSPVVAAGPEGLRAGRALLPWSAVGDVVAARKDEARRERGTGLDSRAYLVIRGWVDPVVRVEVADPADPTPYWLLSTRRPDELTAVIEAYRDDA